MKEIYALGIGHNTPVFIDLAVACGYSIAGLYHYNDARTGETDHGFKIIGSFDDLYQLKDLSGKNFLLTMGDTSIRKAVAEKIKSLGGKIPTLIHPTAVVSSFAKVSDSGVYISCFAHIQADTSIDEGTIILSGVNISHTNKIGKYCFFAGGSTVGAFTEIENEVFFGQGALSISRKVRTIGENALIGARSLLTKDVPANAVVAGSPAKILRFQ